jgi:hypothetical protein
LRGNTIDNEVEVWGTIEARGLKVQILSTEYIPTNDGSEPESVRSVAVTKAGKYTEYSYIVMVNSILTDHIDRNNTRKVFERAILSLVFMIELSGNES